MEKDVAKELRKELRTAVDPIRAAAEDRAGSIGNVGPRWARMKAGVTLRGAYIAPASKRAGGSPRPNLAGLFLDRAMVPAVNEGAGEVAEKVDAMLDRFGRDHGF